MKLARSVINKLTRLHEMVFPQLKVRRLIREAAGPLQLHMGCGKNRLKGFINININIDLNHSTATDLTADIRKLPFPTESMARIECYHAFEHSASRWCANTCRSASVPSNRVVNWYLSCPILMPA